MTSAVIVFRLIVLAYALAMAVGGGAPVRKSLGWFLIRGTSVKQPISLHQMEEENAVMRNLLMDVIENEALVLGSLDGSLEDRIRRLNFRTSAAVRSWGRPSWSSTEIPPHNGS